MAAKFCAECGAKLEEGTKFCPECGEKTAQSNGTAATESKDVKKSASATVATDVVAENLSLWEEFKKVFKNYCNFKGRARRREYWGFVLFNTIFCIGLLLVNAALFFGVCYLLKKINSSLVINFLNESSEAVLVICMAGIYLLYLIAALLPGLAVSVRRLHDKNLPAWILVALLLVLNIFGLIPLFILSALDGTKGENKYGADPKGRIKE